MRPPGQYDRRHLAEGSLCRMIRVWFAFSCTMRENEPRLPAVSSIAAIREKRKESMKYFLVLACLLMVVSTASAQTSPPETATAKIGGATLVINYCAPSVRARKIFGEGGLVMGDPTAPIWRAGANSATAFHTDQGLDVAGLTVPKGDYTLFVNVKDPDAWELIINKQTGQWGLSYDASQDLGRVKMQMSTPPAPIETLKYTISSAGGGKGTIQLAWEKHVASVSVTAK
jgi:hypothetical protein